MFLFPSFLLAQEKVVKSGTDGLKSFFNFGSMYNSLFIIGGTILFLGALWIAWAIARKKQHAMEGLAAWVVALAFFLILKSIFK